MSYMSELAVIEQNKIREEELREKRSEDEFNKDCSNWSEKANYQ